MIRRLGPTSTFHPLFFTFRVAVTFFLQTTLKHCHWQGKARQGKARKGKERKGKERKGKERKPLKAGHWIYLCQLSLTNHRLLSRSNKTSSPRQHLPTLHRHCKYILGLLLLSCIVTTPLTHRWPWRNTGLFRNTVNGGVQPRVMQLLYI